MNLADKMFSRSARHCPLRSSCREETNRKYIRDLFAHDWEVFVIKRDPDKGKYDWFTVCCEAAELSTHVISNPIETACC
jgi:hypothetical protein